MSGHLILHSGLQADARNNADMQNCLSHATPQTRPDSRMAQGTCGVPNLTDSFAVILRFEVQIGIDASALRRTVVEHGVSHDDGLVEVMKY